uniref:DNA ligase (NAD(+)) n=1 Tax=viral metagenome TaxID=1070528 RepID=A0A6M3LKZ8_9ZZZZ
MDQIKILEKQIRYHKKMYYAKGKPIISDQKYDKLENKLKELDPENQLLKTVGVTPKRAKISLPFVLGSLETIGITNALTWMQKQDDDISISWKLDGQSVYVEWNNRKLISLASRGDGKIGENMLHKAEHIENLPKTINENRRVCARGEAVVRKLPDKYKTKRNAVVGILNRDDSAGMKLVMIWFYELIKHPNLPKTEEKRLELLKHLGLYVSPNFLIKKKEIQNNNLRINNLKVTDWLVSLLENKAHNDLELDFDGLVISKNKHNRENEMIPKNKIALKIDTLSIQTKVTELEWNVTRTGRIVPIVHIDAVEIGGVEIESPTGHNFKYIRDKGIDKGAIIEVTRSGDVIPYIKSVIKPAKKIKFPQKCPSCNRITEIDGVDLVCNNVECPGSSIANIEYFLRMLGAEGIGIPTITKLYKAKTIKTIADFYNLKKSDLIRIDGLGDISTDTILEERKKTLTTTQAKLLAAFGIPLVGIKMAKKIMDNHHFKNNFNFMFKMNVNAMYNTLIAIEGIGPSIAQSFIDYIYDFKGLFKFLKNKGLKFIKEKTTNKLKGKSFQFTGAMKKSREEFELLTVNNGGRLSSVNKKLDFLVVADINTTSTKAVRARELEIKIITEDKFIKMIGG